MTAPEIALAASLLSPVLLAGWAYLGYPLSLAAATVVLGRRPGGSGPATGSGGAPAGGTEGHDDPPVWPEVSLLVPAYNEEDVIADCLDRLLALDYPEELRQILVVSDASSDRTDEVVASYADRGVELLALEERHGKTAAQAAAVPRLRGEIVVNVDASIAVPPGSLKPLVRAFREPGVGVASGRDVSASGEADSEATRGEEGYVGYEMWVRSLETRMGSIVGASGCFYATRREVFAAPVPGELSRDFASVLVARELGYRAVSVEEAVCLVPRSGSLASEFRRKVRTMTRGLTTLARHRHLLNPFRHGVFAFMLLSHKVCRWAVPLSLPLAAAALSAWVTVAPSPLALGLAGAAGLGLAAVAAGAVLGDRGPGRVLAPLTFCAAANAAALVAWRNLLRGAGSSVWEPTRRGPGGRAEAAGA